MSWQAYVDTSLLGSGHVDKGAIWNKEGTSQWAASPGFAIQPDELHTIVSNFAENPKNDAPRNIFGTGFKIAGVKYLTIRADERDLYGKKGKEGVLVVLTKQALLIAHYGEQHQPGSAATTVEGLADYLIGLGY